jgi:prolyl 4-hydroxylase
LSRYSAKHKIMAGTPVRSLIEYGFLAVLAFALFGHQLLTPYLPWLSDLISRTNTPTKSNYRDIASNKQDLDLSMLQEDLLLPPSNISCPPSSYRTTIVSRSPLIIYIHDFLSPSELSTLLRLAETSGYETSPIYSSTDPKSESKEQKVDTSIRHSSRSKLPSTNELVNCLAHRALAFQGFPSDTFIEPLWAQKYKPGGHYAHHFDWAGSIRSRGAGRVSTFMVYLDCKDCVGGGTEFPRIPKPVDKNGFWCDVTDCEADNTVFKPIKGNAVYWENVDAEGNSYDALWHSGMPVEDGTKVGLNVWSWYQPNLEAALYKREMETLKSLREDQKTNKPAI